MIFFEFIGFWKLNTARHKLRTHWQDSYNDLKLLLLEFKSSVRFLVLAEVGSCSTTYLLVVVVVIFSDKNEAQNEISLRGYDQKLLHNDVKCSKIQKIFI